MKRIFRFLKSFLLGYEYFTYSVEYNAYTRFFSSYCTDGPYDCPLHLLAKGFNLNYIELRDTLIDTCLCGHIYHMGKSHITIEVKRKKFKVVEYEYIY